MHVHNLELEVQKEVSELNISRNATDWFTEHFYVCLFLEACLRVHKSVTEIDVKEQIAEYLKHAPGKPGGSRYKVLHIQIPIVKQTIQYFSE